LKESLKNYSGAIAEWRELTDEQLLRLRISDLPLRIEGTPLASRVAQLYQELESRGLAFKPHVWLAEEWFTPDGVPGIAIPFYLADPRLIKLERNQMLEVEGGTDRECMRILRHEAGHAISNAYLLHNRKRWRELFGSFAKPYPEFYEPDPDSRNYVLHLNAWYAQAHPAEDFAETFAVWLAPGSRWRRRYKGWPALEKLEYVDRLMKEIAGTSQLNKSRKTVEPLTRVRSTLEEHYRRKREHYAVHWLPFYDDDLRRIFSDDPRHANYPTAVNFLRRIRRDVRHEVAEATGVHHYTIDQLLKDLIDRSRELKLRVACAEDHARSRVMIMLAVQTMNIVHKGYHRIAL
jgi:hypothetical protein